MAFLKAEVERVLKTTGASKVILVGNSRGGNTIRNYVQNGGGDRVVSHVVLGGNPAHGIWAVKGLRRGQRVLRPEPVHAAAQRAEEREPATRSRPA